MKTGGSAPSVRRIAPARSSVNWSGIRNQPKDGHDNRDRRRRPRGRTPRPCLPDIALDPGHDVDRAPAGILEIAGQELAAGTVRARRRERGRRAGPRSPWSRGRATSRRQRSARPAGSTRSCSRRLPQRVWNCGERAFERGAEIRACRRPWYRRIRYRRGRRRGRFSPARSLRGGPGAASAAGSTSPASPGAPEPRRLPDRRPRRARSRAAAPPRATRRRRSAPGPSTRAAATADAPVGQRAEDDAPEPVRAGGQRSRSAARRTEGGAERRARGRPNRRQGRPARAYAGDPNRD